MNISELFLAIWILILFASLRFGLPLLLLWLGKTVYNRVLHWQAS